MRISEVRPTTNTSNVVLEAVTEPRPVRKLGSVRDNVPAGTDTQIRQSLVKSVVSTFNGCTGVKPCRPGSDNAGSSRDKGIASSKSTSKLVNEGVVRKLTNHTRRLRDRFAALR